MQQGQRFFLKKDVLYILKVHKWSLIFKVIIKEGKGIMPKGHDITGKMMPFKAPSKIDTMTKIICTIGPASNNEEIIRAFILEGMNVARINFSHGKREDHAETISLIREISQFYRREVAILVDLQGPKIRTNTFENDGITLENEALIDIIHSEEIGKPGIITTKFKPLIESSKVGEKILIDDGLIKLEVMSKESDRLKCKVIDGGFLKNNKGINLPATKLDIPALTEKDIEDVKFAMELDIDMVAMSFVRNHRDIRSLRRLIKSQGKDISIVSKIEKPEALEDIDNILLESNKIMIARGDLGVEIGNERVPGIQKQLIMKCIRRGIPVITATQMLESMTVNPRPTRAEASDVANAIFDGTDAVMLSGETAAGKYPVQSLKMMKRIIQDAESHPMLFHFDDWEIYDSSNSKLGMSIGKVACMMADQIKAQGISCLSDTGNAAIRITTQRPSIPVYMFSDRLHCVRRMCFVRGCHGVFLDSVPNSDNVFEVMEQKLLEKGYIQKGDQIIYTAGLPSLKRGSTNTVFVKKAGIDT